MYTLYRIFKYSVLPFFAITIISCSQEEEYVPIRLEDGLNALPLSVNTPADNPTTTEKVALGKKLFWDPVLSGNFDVACATCHHPDNGWGDAIDRSIGVGGIGLGTDRTGGVEVLRNAHTIINVAFNGMNENGNYDPSDAEMFWDNRSNSLEEQALDPIMNNDEMRGDAYDEDEAIDEVSERLANIPEYVTLFNEAFGDEANINGENIGKAIAAYERTILANNSRFDQFARGDENALSDFEKTGLNAFMDMNCTACHSGPMFSDYELHDLGVPDNGVNDNGDDGEFRTPSLRNLPETGPYFHNGAFDNLTDAVNFYDDIEENDREARRLRFDEDNTAAVVAFLRALNDTSFDTSIPESVPSGLTVGGNIE